MATPIQNQIRGVFIPVSDIHDARDWYCQLLDLPMDGEIYFGHIYVLKMQGGTDIVLDSKIYAPENVYKVPVIQLATADIEQSFAYVRSQNITVITEIQNGHWFTIQDPDGNLLMVCR